ncbi:MAG: deoxyguanosinetriphosphate triphosphohydrolase [Natronospirillum sp.]|uniref:deoxyguanosinetriphosphate triphosphohydrolase n=1 Tax=Natronospirillum sp. TaxID=2812955 RepID=UPI0025E6BBD6|nr:deoxyguanosinetriphosphate triphosphohydrolase [Natronospirillum sp.]MCH8551644.1 deoxyguanosinetriphosphate triphosphohydrolase [Natronospirillum sp.]
MTEMHWDRLLSTARHGHLAPEPHELGRSHFHKDYDRIVFSGAFRRLSGKTQVHPLSLNDHVHTRLIHSVEVGSVGRSLGLKVGERIHRDLPAWIQPDDIGVIVQAACLAHDIGNPPFGHAGEFAIQDWFRQPQNAPLLESLSTDERQDLVCWEGNAQGFRLVTDIEYHLFRGGLRLTYPTLATMLKYPWTVRHAGEQGKFACFQQEAANLQEIATHLGLIRRGEQRWCRHPLSYLMEAADDICYAIIDLEDAVDLRILQFEEVRDILRQLNPQAELALGAKDEVSPLRKLAALRGKAMQAVIDSVVEAFLRQKTVIMRGELEGELLDWCPQHIGDGIRAAKALAKRKVFKDSHKTEIEIGAYATLSTLLHAFLSAGHELHSRQGQDLSYRTLRVLDLMRDEAPQAHWSLYGIYLRTLDFVTQQTDQYANYLAKQIGGVPLMTR